MTVNQGDGKISFTRVSDAKYAGTQKIKVTHKSAWGAVIEEDTTDVVVNYKLCEPGSGGLELTGKAVTCALTETSSVCTVDLSTAFDTKSSKKDCTGLTYEAKWHDGADFKHANNNRARSDSTIVVGNDGKTATITLKATSPSGVLNIKDGIHVFDITAKSMFGGALSGNAAATGTLTITKKSNLCETAALSITAADLPADTKLTFAAAA